MMTESGPDLKESICWEAKPAPRCYTFRHWRHSIFGAIFLLVSCVWQVLGVDVATEYQVAWLVLLPVPFIIVGLYFTFGHLLQARLEWNNVRYMITDRRVVVKRGVLKIYENSVALNDLTYLQLRMHGNELGTLKLYVGETNRLILHCIEHPRQATGFLEEAIKKNSGSIDSADEVKTPQEYNEGAGLQ